MNSKEVALQPNGGGAVPRIPVAKVVATRDTKRPERTMEQTRADILAGRAKARQELALDDLHPSVPALNIDTVPEPIIMRPPLELFTGFRPVVCLLPDLGGPEASYRTSATRRQAHPNSAPIPILVNQ